MTPVLISRIAVISVGVVVDVVDVGAAAEVIVVGSVAVVVVGAVVDVVIQVTLASRWLRTERQTFLIGD